MLPLEDQLVSEARFRCVAITASSTKSNSLITEYKQAPSERNLQILRTARSKA